MLSRNFVALVLLPLSLTACKLEDFDSLSPRPTLIPGPRPSPSTTPTATPTPTPTPASACQSTSKEQLHVVAIYQSRNDHRYGYHPRGEVSVNVQGSGLTTLVLSSYEPTLWKINAASGITVKRIILNGYHAQDVSGVSQSIVEEHSYERNGKQYDAGYPYELASANSLIRKAEMDTGLKLSSFQGAYERQSAKIDLCVSGFKWERFDFANVPVDTQCNGDRYVRFDDKYQVFVGLILCSSAKYKIMMSPSKSQLFLDVADSSGHGQDHCELVNPFFNIPIDDDIKSGCSNCMDGPGFHLEPRTKPYYSRSRFGEPFYLRSDRMNFTMEWQACGVSIP